ncbi:MAG: T9SS type A sorting domain-containing protein [Candidatus Krumholzibacteria bacterium]|nr:T9SS type A sorting domain-containing protein [Candidatus Krumholzibacteria bacterium]
MTTGRFSPAAAGLAILLLIPPVSYSSADASWIANGNPVCVETGDQWYPRVLACPGGEAIVVWEDHRGAAGNIFAQKIAANGGVIWDGGGMAACADVAGRDFFRQAVPDGNGGAVIAWTDHRDSGIAVYAQRVGSDGACAWGPSAVAVSGGGDCYFPRALPDGSGGAFIVWQQGQFPDSRVFVQRVNGSGAAAWADGGVAVSDAGGQFFPSMVDDGANGVIVAWISGDLESSVIASQRFDSDGARLWSSSARVVVSGCAVNTFIEMCADGSGGTVIAWQDMRNGQQDIFAQRVGSSGTAEWGASGIAVCASDGEQWLPQLAFCDEGEIAAVWADGRGGSDDIYAQRLAPDGTAMWTPGGLCVCGEAESQLNPRILVDPLSNALIAWQDGRGAGLDIYAQKIDRAGLALWAEGGLAISAAEGDQRLPDLAADGAGGAYVTWESSGADADICLQRIDADGTPVATSLASWAVSTRGGAVEIRWSTIEPAPAAAFSISRKGSGCEYFSGLGGDVSIEGESGYLFVDEETQPGSEYVYRVDVNGTEGSATLFETGAVPIPGVSTFLGQNRPNPFNPVTSIAYILEERSFVTLAVYDVAGRRVAVLVEGMEEAGSHAVTWNGTDGRGGQVSSGVYFARLVAGKTALSRKMILLK